MADIFPYARPLYVMAKPAGPLCNLRCQYCYYTEKQHLFPHTSYGMSHEMLEQFVLRYIEVQQTPDILFTWHGGEPLLRPLSFYQDAVRLQRYYGRGRRISNCLQTNGLLLTPEWCRFLAEEHWLVGISIDGTQTMHDTYRTDAAGEGTWKRVVQAITMLNEYGVEWNAMATIQQANVHEPRAFYHFLRDQLGARFLQFTPVVEREIHHADSRHLAHMADDDCPLAPYSVRPDQWGAFLCEVFDEWIRHDVGEMFVQLFDATLAGWMGVAPGVCAYAEECGHALVMEHNGDLYPCDHFVFPEYRLGNLLHDGLPHMAYGTRQEAFSRLKREGLPTQCRCCPWLKACHGECPRLRFMRTADGEPGLNYLCAGYQQFFLHVAPYMDFMRDELQAGRDAAGVMHHFFG
ncbi:MAG: anaerobic sulfatase-maturation protein [Bacteroidaceae bacterium]